MDFLVRDIEENLNECRIFTGHVHEIVEITESVCRILLFDVNRDHVYCLLLGS